MPPTAILSSLFFNKNLKMTLVESIKDMGIRTINNNGSIIVDYGVTGTKNYSNKCFLLAFADGLINMRPNQYKREVLLRQLVSYASSFGIDADAMVDIPEHSSLLQELENRFDIQIHVRSAHNGALSYIDSSKPLREGKVINVLCPSHVARDVLYGHFICVAFHNCLGGMCNTSMY